MSGSTDLDCKKMEIRKQSQKEPFVIVYFPARSPAPAPQHTTLRTGEGSMVSTRPILGLGPGPERVVLSDTEESGECMLRTPQMVSRLSV